MATLIEVPFHCITDNVDTSPRNLCTEAHALYHQILSILPLPLTVDPILDCIFPISFMVSPLVDYTLYYPSLVL